MSIAAIRELVIAILVLLLLIAAYLGWHQWQGMRAELDGLRDFRQSVQTRQAVSDAADVAFGAGKAGAAAQDAQNDSAIAAHARATEEARHEDPDTAAWLAAPVPRRLRDADAAARGSGRLAEDRATPR